MKKRNEGPAGTMSKAVNAYRATLSRNKLSPPGSNVETAARRTGQESPGNKGGRHGR